MIIKSINFRETVKNIKGRKSSNNFRNNFRNNFLDKQNKLHKTKGALKMSTMSDRKKFVSGIVVGIGIMIVSNIGVSIVYPAFSTVFFSESMDPSSKMKEIYSILDSYYVDDYDKDLTLDAMYTGLVYGVGDPYTSYMNTDSTASFLEASNGSYVGIGISLTVDTEDNTILILTAYEGGPASNAGIKAGDKIIKVNGIPFTGSQMDEAITHTKGTDGTPVKLTIMRTLSEGETEILDFELSQAQVDIPTVSHEMLKNDIGYIEITNFDKVTTDQFDLALQKILDSGAKALVLDLRNNPGGLLYTATAIADKLIPEGVIVYTEDKNGKQEFINADSDFLNIPLAILVNENSASASEVLSGAVQDTGRGVLIGTQTFGKGLVQRLFFLPDGSSVKTTVEKYYTPNGVCIQGFGLEPDYIVELSEESKLRPLAELSFDEDAQLQKAVEVLTVQMASN